MSEPGRDLLDRHGNDRSAAERSAAELAAADPYRAPALASPPIGGLATGHGLDRWPSAADDADPLGGSAIPGNLVDALRRRAGAGSPLAEDLRRAGGEALGRDLSEVRIHTDAEAGRLADSVQASAFTYGQDIYFAAGGYRPGEDSGRRLIAHELGHVGQDAGSSGVIGRADDPAEAGADRAAAGVLSALRRQAENVGAVRRTAVLAPQPAAQPASPAIRRARKRKQPHKGGGSKRQMVVAPPPAPAALPIGQVAPPMVAPPTRSFRTDGQPAAPGEVAWYQKGRDKSWVNATIATAAPSTVPTPRTTGSRDTHERPAGSFTLKRQWDRLARQGFIVQEITRDFSGVEVHHGGGWQAASAAVLQAYMAAPDYAELYYTTDRYWEVFEVGADGKAVDKDEFNLTGIADAGALSMSQYANTSRGTFIQTGTAYYVPTTDSLATFGAHFGMAAGRIPLANGLYSVDACTFLTTASALYPVSQPSLFTVRVTWDTGTPATENVTLHITET